MGRNFSAPHSPLWLRTGAALLLVQSGRHWKFSRGINILLRLTPWGGHAPSLGTSAGLQCQALLEVLEIQKRVWWDKRPWDRMVGWGRHSSSQRAGLNTQRERVLESWLRAELPEFKTYLCPFKSSVTLGKVPNLSEPQPASMNLKTEVFTSAQNSAWI